MGTITINGKKVEFTNEKNLLTIIRKAGIEVPTLCYQPELSIFGACRLCTVEDDRGRCFASCSEEPRDGMVIYTHTEKLRKHRKLIIELLLAAHCRDCTTCDKHGKCTLQKLAYQHGINNVRFDNHREQMKGTAPDFCALRPRGIGSGEIPGASGVQAWHGAAAGLRGGRTGLLWV